MREVAGGGKEQEGERVGGGRERKGTKYIE